jgi:acyl-CoA reductase-like NAD-dependent aldehyde dehydrogenase
VSVDPLDVPGLVIRGEVVAGDEPPYRVVDPGRPTEVVTHAPAASAAQVDAAVAAATAAGPGWSGLSLEERIAWVVAAAEVAVQPEEVELLARPLTRENGKVLAEAEFEVATVSAIAETFAGLAREALMPVQLPDGGRVTFHPHGVVAALLPFNWPLSVCMTKIAPALMAGNTVVVKPPPTCPAVVLYVARQMAEVLPPGVLNTVSGPGTDVAEALVTQPGVAMTTLTGGGQAGRAILRASADRLAPALLELGGNDAGIVAPDVEPTEDVAADLFDAAMASSGQVCTALKRLYVPARHLDQWVEALAVCAAATVTGHGLNPDVTHGPVHTAAAEARAATLLAEAMRSGATVVQPGGLHTGPSEVGGHYVRPAVVARPDPTSALVTDEQFAPLLPVLGYRAIGDAVTAANSTRFGLGASVWTADGELASAVAEQLRAGTVYRNAHGPGGLDPRLPFGGWGESGLGVEFGVDGVRAYTRPRSRPRPRPLPGPASR